MASIKNRSADSDDDISILEELLIRGMSLKDATVLVTDMLMAGIDTVRLEKCWILSNVFVTFLYCIDVTHYKLFVLLFG